MIINSWTDEGMDWDNPDINNPAYLQAIHDCFLQKQTAIGTVAGSFAHPRIFYENYGLEASSDYFFEIDSRLFRYPFVEGTTYTYLYGQFINHTEADEFGYFNNTDYIPIWSLSGLLDYLEEELVVPYHYMSDKTIMNAWLKQRKKILDLMRWVGDSNRRAWSVSQFYSRYSSNSPYPTTIEQAYNECQAQPWNELEWWFDNYLCGAVAYYNNLWAAPRCSYQQYKSDITLLHYCEVKYSVDFYQQVYTPPESNGRIGYISTSGVEPISSEYLHNKFVKLATSEIEDDHEHQLTVYPEYSSHDFVTLNAPANPDYFFYDTQYTYGYRNPIVVRKFDGLDGFTFRGDDWDD